jgi:hypothetical protein
MVDQATAGIRTRLAPGEEAARPNVGASLTSSLEAPRAYEEGLNFRGRVLEQIGTILQSGRKSSLLKVTVLHYLCKGQS